MFSWLFPVLQFACSPSKLGTKTALLLSPTRLHSNWADKQTGDDALVGGILLFYGCCNKLPPMQWLKTTHTYFLTVLKVSSGSPWAKVSCLQAAFLSGGSSPLPVSRGRLHSFGSRPPILLQSQQQPVSPSYLLMLPSLCFFLLPPSSTFRDPCDNHVHTIQDHLPF